MQKYKSNIKNEFKKRTYKFALDVIGIIDSLPKEQTCKIISNQLLRSATSIGANTVEAHAASSKKDYTNFFNHALKSSNETKFWLGLLRDSGKASEDKTNILLQESFELANIFASSILTLKSKK
jgi:four helix bundle protein